MTLVEELMAAIYQFDICQPEERAARAALSVITKRLRNDQELVNVARHEIGLAADTHSFEEMGKAVLRALADHLGGEKSP